VSDFSSLVFGDAFFPVLIFLIGVVSAIKITHEYV
jgi:hypothetical protein